MCSPGTCCATRARSDMCCPSTRPRSSGAAPAATCSPSSSRSWAAEPSSSPPAQGREGPGRRYHMGRILQLADKGGRAAGGRGPAPRRALRCLRRARGLAHRHRTQAARPRGRTKAEPALPAPAAEYLKGGRLLPAAASMCTSEWRGPLSPPPTRRPDDGQRGDGQADRAPEATAPCGTPAPEPR